MPGNDVEPGAVRDIIAAVPRPFPAVPWLPMVCAMDDVTLPPELERFAAEAVAAGLSLLQRAEVEVAEFAASLEEARAEGERDGFLTAEQVEQRVRAAIEDAAAGRR